MLSLLIAQAVAKQLVANMKAKTKGVVDVEIDEDERSLMFSLEVFQNHFADVFSSRFGEEDFKNGKSYVQNPRDQNHRGQTKQCRAKL